MRLATLGGLSILLKDNELIIQYYNDWNFIILVIRFMEFRENDKIWLQIKILQLKQKLRHENKLICKVERK